MKIHQLKCWPRFFSRIQEGSKTFEIRENDRDFQVGDQLWLEEWDEKSGSYTGATHQVWINYILHGPQFGLKKGFCIMSISGKQWESQ